LFGSDKAIQCNNNAWIGLAAPSAVTNYILDNTHYFSDNMTTATTLIMVFLTSLLRWQQENSGCIECHGIVPRHGQRLLGFARNSVDGMIFVLHG
jgi:hypothetical protein